MLWLMGKTFLTIHLKLTFRHNNIWEITTGQADGCNWLFAGSNYFNRHYKMIAIDLSKQQALNANLNAIQ